LIPDAFPPNFFKGGLLLKKEGDCYEKNGKMSNDNYIHFTFYNNLFTIETKKISI